MTRQALATALLAGALLVGCGSTGAGSGDDTSALPRDVAGAEQDAGAEVDARAEVDAADATLPTTPGGLPLALPFAFERPAEGEPIPEAEVQAFTRALTGLWRQIGWYDWVYETTHGVDASTGRLDYLIWWHDVEAEKTGDTVTFRNNKEDGGSHNNAVPTMLALTSAIGGYLSGRTPEASRLVLQLTRSIHAVTLGFVYDEHDPIDFLMARNIVAQNHAFTLQSGKKKAVDYTEWYFGYEGWNADRFRYELNPTWGDIWVTNKRSKDDLPYFYRVGAWLPYVAELAPDPEVRQVAAEALDLLTRFAKDIVDSGYQIRTKDANGVPGFVDDQDLDSFVQYVSVFPDAECDPRLGAALLGYGEPLGVACGPGQGSPYDTIAGTGNYFNYDIIVHFHLAAIALALVKGQPQVAHDLLGGLATRIDRYRDPASKEPGQKDLSWGKDVVTWLVMGASVGLPLTADEARQVMDHYARTVDDFRTFPRWDLWAASVPDGTYNFRDGGMYPEHRPELVDVEFLAMILETCWSPFRNPAGARFVDCDVVNDPARWGSD